MFDFDETIKNNLKEIPGLRVEVSYDGARETDSPTVWLAVDEIDFEEEDVTPRRYGCKQKMILLVLAKSDISAWLKKIFNKIEEKRKNVAWENIKINTIKRGTEGLERFFYIELEIRYNLILELSTPGGEAVLETNLN